MKSWVLVSSWLVLLLSCSTLNSSPVLQAGYNRSWHLDVPYLIWQNQGPLRYTSGQISNPPLLFWAIEVSLDNPAIQIVVGPDPLSYGVVPAIKVSSFAHQYDCVAAINGNPFDKVSDREGEPRQVVGIAIQEGFIIADPVSRYWALFISRDQSAHIVHQESLRSPEGTIDYEILKTVRFALGGFFLVLNNGTPITGKAIRHPRSAVGVSQDGKKLYLLAIDGRRKDSIGATEDETGQILSALGAWDGLILDGGGSTSLVLRNQAGKLEVLNHPLHEGILNRERAVATCLGIRVLDKP
ncbi:phosphodiester glycosidase family protein [Gracilinema caldarium]|nr:phosphodiester glycosidase family protein [Gracilinema caldarium]